MLKKPQQFSPSITSISNIIKHARERICSELLWVALQVLKDQINVS